MILNSPIGASPSSLPQIGGTSAYSASAAVADESSAPAASPTALTALPLEAIDRIADTLDQLLGVHVR